MEPEREAEIKLVEAIAAETIRRVMETAGLKHPCGEWRKQTYAEHLDHAHDHLSREILRFHTGGASDDEDLTHAACRIAMAVWKLRNPTGELPRKPCVCVHTVDDNCCNFAPPCLPITATANADPNCPDCQGTGYEKCPQL